MELVCNIAGCKPHTWARVVFTTNASLEIQEQQFSEHFRAVVSFIWKEHFSHAFEKRLTFGVVFAFLHFYVSIYLSLQHCVKGKFNF